MRREWWQADLLEPMLPMDLPAMMPVAMGEKTMTDSRITKAESLTDLLDTLREIDAECDEGETDMQHVVDMASLPTFGGEEPSNTSEIWSWDADSLLVGTCVDDMKIVDRAKVADPD